MFVFVLTISSNFVYADLTNDALQSRVARRMPHLRRADTAGRQKMPPKRPTAVCLSLLWWRHGCGTAVAAVTVQSKRVSPSVPLSHTG